MAIDIARSRKPTNVGFFVGRTTGFLLLEAIDSIIKSAVNTSM
jgi:hypothetical protein